MSKPDKICVRGLKCRHINHPIQTGVDEYDRNAEIHTAPTYLHEWYKACQQEAQIEECHGDTEKVPWIKAGMESVRKFVLDEINYDIATNTITAESEDK